jgi:hypothetical protein
MGLEKAATQFQKTFYKKCQLITQLFTLDLPRFLLKFGKMMLSAVSDTYNDNFVCLTPFSEVFLTLQIVFPAAIRFRHACRTILNKKT